MKWKKIFIIMLTILLLFTFIPGCSKSDKSIKNTNIAMGRYVEKSIDLPEAVQSGEETATIFLSNPEGQPELYTSSSKAENGDKVIQYTLNQENTWERSIPKWLNGNGMVLYDLTYAPDGTKYAIAAFQNNKNYKVKFLKSTDSQTSEEIILNTFKEEVDYKKLPFNIDILENSSILLGYHGYCTVYKDGKETVSFKIGDYSYALSKHKLMSLSENLKGGSIIDVNTGKTLSSVPLDSSASYDFCSDKEGSWYMINAAGIHRMTENGSTWETILDGSIGSMSKPGLFIDKIILGADEDFYVKYEDEQGQCILKHYIFDKNMPTTPSNTLTILSLKECPTVRQAIVDFQLEHTDVQVEYSAIANETDGATVTDHIKTINAELLSHKGADILILDGMPVNSYISKGLLTDLSEIVNPLLENGILLSNIINNYKTEDGKFFAVPIRITIPLAYGDREAVKSTVSINKLAEYAGKSSVPLFGPNIFSYADLTTNLFNLYSNSFLKEDGFDREGLVNFLTQLKIICDQTIPAAEKSASAVEMGSFSISSYLVYAKHALLGIDAVNHMYKVYAPIAVTDMIDGSYSSVNDEFTPYELVGINNASKQKELAKEFLASLFEEAVQSLAAGDGFPVNINALNSFGMAEDDYAICYDDLEFTQPDKEKLQSVLDLCKKAKTPTNPDEELLAMVKPETEAFLSGKADAQSTADQLIAKLKTYLTE